MKIQLSLVRVVVPVKFDSPSTTTLTARSGDLFLDTDEGVVAAKLHASKLKLLIPLANVSHMEPLDQKEAEELKANKVKVDKERKAAAVVKKPEPDVVRFEKTPDGSIQEVSSKK